MINPEFHVLNWQFCSKTPNDIYRTFLSGTYTVNDKEITFKNAMMVCVNEQEGEVIFSVILPESGHSLDVHGRHFVGTITERHYEYTADDPHSCCSLFDRTSKTVKWNSETQLVEEFPSPIRQTREETEADWRHQFSINNTLFK